MMKGGVLQTGKGMLRTRQHFTDVQVHVEFATPSEVKGDSQGRGNSGVFLLGHFEIQVLDSYRNITYPDGQAASMYGQYPPLVNAARAPGQWQTYDIIFTAPRFTAAGTLEKSGGRHGAAQRGRRAPRDAILGSDTPPERAAVHAGDGEGSARASGSRKSCALSQYLGAGAEGV